MAFNKGCLHQKIETNTGIPSQRPSGGLLRHFFRFFVKTQVSCSWKMAERGGYGSLAFLCGNCYRSRQVLNAKNGRRKLSQAQPRVYLVWFEFERALDSGTHQLLQLVIPLVSLAERTLLLCFLLPAVTLIEFGGSSSAFNGRSGDVAAGGNGAMELSLVSSNTIFFKTDLWSPFTKSIFLLSLLRSLSLNKTDTESALLRRKEFRRYWGGRRLLSQ